MSNKRRSDADAWVEHTVRPEAAGDTLETVLRTTMGISRRMLQRLTRSGGIRINGRKAHLAGTVRSGDVVATRTRPSEQSGLIAVAMPLDVVWEDRDVLVINKAAGLLVHPLSPRHTHTLAHGVAHHFASQGLQAKVRPVHRLDRDTSGLVLFAKSAVVHHQLDRQLRTGEMGRTYLALVHGAPNADFGRVDAPIGAHPRHPHLRAIDPAGDAARTEFRVVERYARAALLELQLETGRTHQLRVHLAHLGHAVIGDRQYGGGTTLLARQALHARQLTFIHPSTGGAVECRAPLPGDIAELRDRLQAQEE